MESIDLLKNGTYLDTESTRKHDLHWSKSYDHIKIKSRQKSELQTTLRGESPQKHGLKNTKTKEARDKLIALSQTAKEQIEMLAATTGEGLGVNEMLITMYQASTGAEVFKTFNDWKKEGHTVKKGETAFRIWGSPVKAKKSDKEAQAIKPELTTETDSKYKFWPMCCVFSNLQVDGIEHQGGEAAPVEGKKTELKEPKKRVNVAEFRNKIEHLERVFGVDRHSCVGDKEKASWRIRVKRVLDVLESVYCATAKAEDTERYNTAVTRVKAYLADNPEPTPPKPSKKSSTSEPSPFVMIDFQERKEARKDRMNERADKARSDSAKAYSKAKDMAAVIPFGQPILVGHHSETRDRNYRGKITSTFDKSFKLSDKADYYENKANSIDHTSISTTDPEALSKLQAKLDNLRESQRIMKAVNKALRSGNDSALATTGLSDAALDVIRTPDSMGNIGFASYRLSNNNAEIRRTATRIANIESLRKIEPIKFDNDDFSVSVENGQVRFVFKHGKPSDEVRTMIHKDARFNWSRYQTAWVRKATIAAVCEAEQLIDNLRALNSIYDEC